MLGFFLLTGTEWPLMVATVLELRWNRPSLGPNIIAPIRAAIPPSTWTTPLPAKSCQKQLRYGERYRRSGFFLGGEGKFYYFLFYFFWWKWQTFVALHRTSSSEEIEAWYNSNCSLCSLGIMKLCLLKWKIRFHFALGWELSYTKLYIERKILNQEKKYIILA